MRFYDLVAAAQERTRSTLAVALAPAINRLPYEIQRYDDPFLPFGKAVIDATADLACAYVFHLGAYLALGGAGAVALERTIAYVPAGAIKILHGPFANAEYVRAAFEDGFGADAVTLVTWSSGMVEAYLQSELRGAFVYVHSNLTETDDRTLIQNFPGQIGVYRPDTLEFDLHPPDSNEQDLTLLIRTNSSVAYASQGSDFREPIRSAAKKFRKPS